MAAPFDPALARTIAREGAHIEGALLPILHTLQARFGWIPPEAVAIVADELNLSRAEVHGVVTFYHDFRAEPAGEHVLKLCMAEACQARGARRIVEKLEETLGVKLGETKPDRSITFEPIYCLGLCGNGPNAMLDNKLYADLEGRGFARCLKVMRS
jgi:formate dehydrogenase subunit gamma